MPSLSNFATYGCPGLGRIEEETIIESSRHHDFRAKLLAEFAWQRDSFFLVDGVRVLAYEHFYFLSS